MRGMAKKGFRRFSYRVPYIMDVCPQCRTHFRCKKAKRLFKDIAECTKCGNIWIMRSVAEFEKYIEA